MEDFKVEEMSAEQKETVKKAEEATMAQQEEQPAQQVVYVQQEAPAPQRKGILRTVLGFAIPAVAGFAIGRGTDIGPDISLPFGHRDPCGEDCFMEDGFFFL